MNLHFVALELVQLFAYRRLRGINNNNEPLDTDNAERRSPDAVYDTAVLQKINAHHPLDLVYSLTLPFKRLGLVRCLFIFGR